MDSQTNVTAPELFEKRTGVKYENWIQAWMISRTKTITFLHGMESSTNCSKVKWLRDRGHRVFNPKMKYDDEHCFNDTVDMIKHIKCDLIVGSSMGGYFAYKIGKHLNIPMLLLNPALHSRTYKTSADDEMILDNVDKPDMFVALGMNDDIIDPIKTMKYLTKYEKMFMVNQDNYGHRTSVEYFEKAFNKFFREDKFIE